MTEAEIAAIVAKTEEGNRAFVNGKFGDYVEAYFTTRHEDMTVSSPFGAVSQGWPQLDRAAVIWAKFTKGESRTEVIKTHHSGDLLVVVQIEHQTVHFEGDPAPQNWTLRATLVYRREADGWRVVHRHADPLSERRTLDETKAIARGADRKG